MPIERDITRKKITYYNGTKGETETMRNGKALGIFGFVATVIGFLASLLSKRIEKIQQEDFISKEVEKAVEKRLKN